MIQKFKELPTWAQIGIAIIVILLALFIVNKIIEVIQKPKLAPVNWNNVPIYGGGQNGEQPTYWNPDPLAREISEKLEGWNLNVYPNTMQKILELQTDDQIKLLYNHYNSKYAKDQPTLTQLIASEWGYNTDLTGTYREVVSKLRSLGLN